MNNELNWGNFNEDMASRNQMMEKAWETDIEKADKQLAPGGRWVTVDGRHIHIGKDGNVDAGKVYGKDHKDSKDETTNNGGKDQVSPEKERAKLVKRQDHLAGKKASDPKVRAELASNNKRIKEIDAAGKGEKNDGQKRLKDFQAKDDKARASMTPEKRVELRKEWNKTSGVSWEDYLDKHSKGDKKETKLSDRAQGYLNRSELVFKNMPDSEKKIAIDHIKKQLGKDKSGKSAIGMGLDKDMVAAGEAFLAKHDKKGKKEASISEVDKKARTMLNKLSDGAVIFGVNKGDIKKLLDNPNKTHGWNNDHFNKVESAIEKLSKVSPSDWDKVGERKLPKTKSTTDKEAKGGGKTKPTKFKGYDVLNNPPMIGDSLKMMIRHSAGHSSGTEGKIYEVSPSGKTFKLEDDWGNKNPKWFNIQDFKTANIKRSKEKAIQKALDNYFEKD